MNSEFDENQIIDNSTNPNHIKKKKRTKTKKKEWKAGNSNPNIPAEEKTTNGGKRLLDRIAPKNLNPRDF